MSVLSLSHTDIQFFLPSYWLYCDDMLCRVYTNQHWQYSAHSPQRLFHGKNTPQHSFLEPQCLCHSELSPNPLHRPISTPTYSPTHPPLFFFKSPLFSLSLPSWDHSRCTCKHRHCRKHLFTTPWTLYYGGLHLLCESGGHVAVKLQLYGPCSCVFFPGPSLDNLPFPASYSLHLLHRVGAVPPGLRDP